MADNEQPERREPNHLQPRSAAPLPAPVDPEQQKQFEQYQQFQQFLKFQEAKGGALVPAGPPPKKPPLWKKILFSKGFRKLVLVAIVIIGVIWAYNHYFGPPPDDGLGTQGGAGPGTGEESGRRSENPNAGTYQLYVLVARGDKEACTLFNDSGARAFALDFDAADCPAAVAKLAGKVDGSPLMPRVKWTSLQEVAVSSCKDMTVKPGTKLLGKLIFSKRTNGWLISGHEPEPDPCPKPTAPPTSN